MATATDTAIITGTVEDATPPSMALVANPFERMALRLVDNGGDLAKLDQLLDLQLKWGREQAHKAHVAAMAAFKAEPIDIVKSKGVGYNTSDGGFVGYKHATSADVVDAVVPAMAKHGLSHSWSVKQEGGQVIVTCTVSHRDGHSESVTMQAAPDNSGKKNAIQQVASTVTYLQRYTLMAICGVAARDQQEDDGQAAGDAEPEQELTPAQQEEARNERKRHYFIAAYQDNEDAVLQIKMKIATDDIAGAARIWFSLTQEEQMALYLAPTKAGQYKDKCFTTAQRDIIKNKFTQYATKA